jgi:hypothetical protein
MKRAFVALVLAGLVVAPVAGAYADQQLPRAVNLYARVSSYGTYGNADYPASADCSVAAVGYLLQTWSHSGPLRSAPFLAAYHQLDGDSQTAGLTDVQVLNYWQDHGIDGYRIRSWRFLGPTSSRVALERAVDEDGALYAIIEIPISLPLTGTWSLANSPVGTGVAGAHAAALVGYNRTGPVLVSWGRVQQVTWGWWRAWSLGVDAVERSSRPWKPNTVDATSVTISFDSYPPTQQSFVTYGVSVTVSGVETATAGAVTVYDNGQPISTCDPLAMTASGNALVGTCDVTYPSTVPSQHSITASFSGDKRYASSGTFGATTIDID